MTSPGIIGVGGSHAPKKMGLLPLEFADCLLDSPYFRENLRAHERQLDQTSADIKGIIKDVQDVVEAAKTVSKAKRTLAASLANFQFDCLGTSLTDDEIIIANSLKEFARFLNEVEDEMDRMLDHAHEKFIQPLVDFRKKQIGSVKMTKKDFDKATSRFCAAQDNYIKLKKEESLAEAAEAARHEQKGLRSASLDYVYLMHVVQERKKFEFVEALLSFMHSWSNYYRFGHERTEASSNYMSDLKSRVQRCRANYDATCESYESLKNKMAQDYSHDPGIFNPMYTRQGYLYVQQKNKSMPFNVVGSQWVKHYCQYQAKTQTLTMIPYNQLNGKITTTETVRVTECVCKNEDSAEKFRFVITAEDFTQSNAVVVTYTLQAMSELERKNWVEALGGTWPAVNALQKLRADSVEDNLNSMAFTFLKDCLHELESRGLTDQGLYRVGGVVSKVKKLLNEGLITFNDRPLDLSDPKQWESKTIASAVKQYFRDLSKPLMTHTLYMNFVEAVKNDSEVTRVEFINATLKKLPVANREMLKVLIRHLAKVAGKHDINLMTAANLGVVFGPTLLRPKEETVASIMDIKFCNEVVEILIENCDTFFPLHSDSSPEGPSKRKGKAPPVPNAGSHHHDREQRGSSTPKRTHSFSSFSQLSTNSLPDIKELHPTAAAAGLSIANHRHHHYHHHHHHLHHHHQPSRDVPDHGSSSKLKKAMSKDEDLMASLEMMESLAADLPQNNGLKRSYTVHHRSNKPPLPKLSSPVISSPTTVISYNNHHSAGSDTSSTGSNNSHHFTTAKQVLTSRISPTSSGSSPSIYPTSSPKPNRPRELFVRQITLPMDSKLETPIVPSPSLVENSSSYRNQVPPPIPARRYPRAYHQVVENTSNASDSGILTSPSPPTDSGIAMMSPPVRKASEDVKKSSCEDNLSLCSSTESDSTGSRYDNVVPKNSSENHRRFSNETNVSKTSTLVAAAAEIAAQRLSTTADGNGSREISTQTIHNDGEDGDDEDEETSDSSSDILVLDSSSEGSKKYFEEDLDEEEDEEDVRNHDEIEISDHFRRGGRSDQKYRGDSGPYDNFTLPGAVLPPPPPSSVTSSVSPASSPNNKLQARHDLEPASIKRLLAAGPTSNV